MEQVMVFAGTTEGYEISRFLQRHEISVRAYVATEYGSKSLRPDAYLTVLAGRLNQEEMETAMQEGVPAMVIDATHPYASEVTANIRRACEKTGRPYYRLLRASDGQQEEAVYVRDVQEAAAYLSGTKGNVLLTTGSKELAAFTVLPNYRERLFARVLSLPSVVASCGELGFEGRHLIAMQGPFSREMNRAMLKQYDCRYLVTKDTGEQGGFLEKYRAALDCGCVPVVIGRPPGDTGLSMDQMKEELRARFGFSAKPEITLVGIGMGAEGAFTVEGKKACEEAELIIGAKRLADAASCGQRVYYAYRSEEIASYIKGHPQYEKIVVALSGDVGFYSGARKLTEALQGMGTLRSVCGISSVVYFMAKIGLSWDDAKIVSAHGRDCNLVSEIRHREKVFAILGTREGVASLAKKLAEYRMGGVRLYVGENLSYPEERVFCRRAEELTDYSGEALSVVCAVNDSWEERPTTHGLPDTAFLRGKAPMTKEEVRAVSLAKLGLKKDSICYDVGAGTGSVSVEMALRAWQGRVYAIEKKEEACALLRENRKKFALDHLEIAEGLAPEAMEGLPAPTHAFIGGSSGNLLEIIECLLKKNSQVQMVVNCITLETVAEAMEAVKKLGLSQVDIAQVSVAKSKSVGRYHMMMGENPIYIITCRQ